MSNKPPKRAVCSRRLNIETAFCAFVAFFPASEIPCLISLCKLLIALIRFFWSAGLLAFNDFIFFIIAFEFCKFDELFKILLSILFNI